MAAAGSSGSHPFYMQINRGAWSQLLLLLMMPLLLLMLLCPVHHHHHLATMTLTPLSRLLHRQTTPQQHADGLSHGVLFLNSNAMEVDIGDTTVTFRCAALCCTCSPDTQTWLQPFALHG